DVRTRRRPAARAPGQEPRALRDDHRPQGVRARAPARPVGAQAAVPRLVRHPRRLELLREPRDRAALRRGGLQGDGPAGRRGGHLPRGAGRGGPPRDRVRLRRPARQGEDGHEAGRDRDPRRHRGVSGAAAYRRVRPGVVRFHHGAARRAVRDEGAMSTINFAIREINFKIVYYGPGLSGKTTNLKQIYDQVPSESKGEMVSLATEDERTLFFDFLPLDLGKVNGFKTRFHLYTVPGQVFYTASRKLILRGVDGVVFVADSSIARLRANAESLRNLRENLTEYNLRLGDVPLVLPANQRDVEYADDCAKLQRR